MYMMGYPNSFELLYNKVKYSLTLLFLHAFSSFLNVTEQNKIKKKHPWKIKDREDPPKPGSHNNVSLLCQFLPFKQALKSLLHAWLL